MSAVPLRYPVSRPALGAEERRLLLDAFDSGWISSFGPYVTEVTRAFPLAVGAASGLPCSNGTVALHLAMLALGVGPDDEVIVPNFTYVATANAPLFVGAKPVLADVRESDWAIDPEQVVGLIGPRTRGVIATHLYGIVGDLTALRRLCDERGLWLVEDCAEVVGAPCVGPMRPGFWGELSTWSFYGNKVITCGEGGFVTTERRPDLIERATSYRGQAVDPNRRYWHRHLGFNFRLSNLQCALLVAQLATLRAACDARERIRGAYDAVLADVYARGHLLPAPRPHVCWLYSARVASGGGAGGRDALLQRLEARHGIETRPFFHPMDGLPHLSGARHGPLDVSHRLAAGGFNLPTYVGLTDADVGEICFAVRHELAKGSYG